MDTLNTSSVRVCWLAVIGAKWMNDGSHSHSSSRHTANILIIINLSERTVSLRKGDRICARGVCECASCALV